MEIIPRTILADIISEWTPDSQINKMLEEMGELIVAICKARLHGYDSFDDKGRSRRNHIQEEIADVLIMAQQMAELFGYADVSKFEQIKITRTLKRLELHKKEKQKQ